MTATFTYFTPLARSYFVTQRQQDQRRKLRTVQFFFPHLVLSPVIIFATRRCRLFNSKVPSNVTSPLNQNRGYSSQTHTNPCHFETYLCFSWALSQTLCIRMPPPPCLFLKTHNLVHLHFCIPALAKKPLWKWQNCQKEWWLHCLRSMWIHWGGSKAEEWRTWRREYLKRNLPLGFPRPLCVVENGLTGLSGWTFAPERITYVSLCSTGLDVRLLTKVSNTKRKNVQGDDDGSTCHERAGTWY